MKPMVWVLSKLLQSWPALANAQGQGQNKLTAASLKPFDEHRAK
jgi:hypothetical protein